MFSRRRQPPVIRQRPLSQDFGDATVGHAFHRQTSRQEPMQQAAIRQFSFHQAKAGGRWAPLARRGIRTTSPQV